MKTENKYLITTTVAGAIFLNSNTGKEPTITITKSSRIPFTEEQKELYSDDLEAYGPKIILSGYSDEGETETPVEEKSSKKASKKTSKKVSKKAKTNGEVSTKVSKKASKKVSKEVEAVQDEVQEEVENKLEATAIVSAQEVKEKVKALKRKYTRETDIKARRVIKKEIENLIESINA